MKKIGCFLLLMWIGCSVNAQPTNDVKPVVFKIRNFGVLVEGYFSGLKGEIKFDPINLTDASFDVTINAASINTGIALRDKHLRKDEYLFVNNYPLIKFTSSKVVKGNKSNEWIVSGTLTIKKIAKEISFPFLYHKKEGGNLLSGEFTINRRDFNVGGKSISMADELTVTLNVIN